ncbi:hypothetical protein F5X96DRAFT_672034 [Biscogniauxia mediterranea]|nr:hypothetical protein F5X96DRAFT_672034 [Biscogniauxia mediterranea]
MSLRGMGMREEGSGASVNCKLTTTCFIAFAAERRNKHLLDLSPPQQHPTSPSRTHPDPRRRDPCARGKEAAARRNSRARAPPSPVRLLLRGKVPLVGTVRGDNGERVGYYTREGGPGEPYDAHERILVAELILIVYSAVTSVTASRGLGAHFELIAQRLQNLTDVALLYNIGEALAITCTLVNTPFTLLRIVV